MKTMSLKSTPWRVMCSGSLVALLALGAGACSGDSTPDGGIGRDGDGGGGGDDQECPVICSTDADCCAGQTCNEGICSAGNECPSGCNYECDKAAGEVCNPATKKCEPGAPPVNCVSDCDCYAGESCIGGECVPSGGDL
jgi:hypothetical protein